MALRLPVCRSSNSSVTRVMISGCSRQSNRSLVLIVECIGSSQSSTEIFEVKTAPSRAVHWSLNSYLSCCNLTADVLCAAPELAVQASWDLTSQFVEGLTSKSFLVSCWQHTGMRCGPKGILKGADSVNKLLFLLTCPVESLFNVRLSPGSRVRFRWQVPLCLWAQALTARFTHCMFSSWDATPSCRNKTQTSCHREIPKTGSQPLKKGLCVVAFMQSIQYISKLVGRKSKEEIER